MSVLKSLPIISLLCINKLLAQYEEDTTLRVKHMIKTSPCEEDSQEWLAEHGYRTLLVRSKVECVVQCRLDDMCLSIVYDRGNYTCHLADTKVSDNCTSSESSGGSVDRNVLIYKEVEPCGEGEVLSGGRCVCAPGFAGTPCKRHFRDCSDIRSYGNWQGNTVYSILPVPTAEPFEVLCRHITHTRTYFMQRRKKKNRLDFNESWETYKEGFGDFDADFWIGLEKLHAITSARKYQMRLTIKFINDTIKMYVYDDFQVTSEATGYRLLFNTSHPNSPDDCFLPLYNAPFSTYDHDVDDNDSVNCAQVRKGGFWYRGARCSQCSPHGVIYGEDSGLLTGAADEAFWTSLGNVAPYKVNMYLVVDEY